MSFFRLSPSFDPSVQTPQLIGGGIWSVLQEFTLSS
jgi:hypothetical protein